MGTDRNIADWLLEHRAKTMSSLLSFFHEDLGIMAKVYDNNAKFSAKLYQLFETYIKSLFLGGNIFSYVPLIKLPKVSIIYETNDLINIFLFIECQQCIFRIHTNITMLSRIESCLRGSSFLSQQVNKQLCGFNNNE